MRRVKLVALTVLPTLLLLGALEVGWRVVYFQLHSDATWALGDLYQRLTRSPDYRVAADGPLFVRDSQLGFASAPGVRHITVTGGRGTHSFSATVGIDGSRVTASPGPRDGAGPEVWIFGCSLTWGWGVNDAETYPWLIQERFPDLRVRNLGGNAYSNTHALVQLRTLVATGARPAVAVFAYNSFDLARNIAAPDWLQSLHIVRTAFQDLTYLRAGFDRDGRLFTTLVPIVNPGLDRTLTRVIRPDPYYEMLVTKEIFRVIKGVADDHGIPVILAFQTADSNDAVVAYARALGYHIADLSVPSSHEYTLYPVDHHPNAAGQRLYATKLGPVLTEVVRRSLGR